MQENKDDRKNTSPFDFFNPATEYATEAEAAKRLEICKSCPDLVPIVNQCMRCGCFMNLKTKLKLSRCPIEKW